MSTSPLVDCDWLEAHLDDGDLRVLDASWYLPQQGRDAVTEFAAAHIPGAVFFDIDGIGDNSTDLPHMLAAPDRFARMVGDLGVRETDNIVVYDGAGLFSAARAWWNLKLMGAQRVRVLDGGLPRWLAEGKKVAAGAAHPSSAAFVAHPKAGGETAASVLAALESGTAQVVDVRPAGRFCGEVAEPRVHLRSGHMPGAVNLPFVELVENGRLKPDAALQKLLDDRGIDPRKPIISSCGSGVTAPLLNLALHKLGHEAMHVYDGSWAEWGGRDDLPVTKD